MFWKRRGKTRQRAFDEYATGWECVREWNFWTSKSIWNEATQRVGQAHQVLIVGKSVGTKGIIDIGLRIAHYFQSASKRTNANDRNYEENNSGDDKAIRATARANVQLCRGKDNAVLKFKLSCAAFLRLRHSFYEKQMCFKFKHTCCFLKNKI